MPISYSSARSYRVVCMVFCNADTNTGNEETLIRKQFQTYFTYDTQQSRGINWFAIGY